MTYQEIDSTLRIGKSLYQVLDRLEDRHLITKRKSETNSRSWVYAVPLREGDTVETEQNYSPPHISQTGVVETTETQLPQDSQQFNTQFNTSSTPIQQPLALNGVLNCYNPDPVSNATPIQQDSSERGGCVVKSNVETVELASQPASVAVGKATRVKSAVTQLLAEGDRVRVNALDSQANGQKAVVTTVIKNKGRVYVKLEDNQILCFWPNELERLSG